MLYMLPAYVTLFNFCVTPFGALSIYRLLFVGQVINLHKLSNSRQPMILYKLHMQRMVIVLFIQSFIGKPIDRPNP